MSELHRLLGKRRWKLRLPPSPSKDGSREAPGGGIGVSRSNLIERLNACESDRRNGLAGRWAVIAELPTYGYRRVHAILKRQALAAGSEVVEKLCPLGGHSKIALAGC